MRLQVIEFLTQVFKSESEHTKDIFVIEGLQTDTDMYKNA